MQLRYPCQSLRQPPARQPPPVFIHDLDVMVVFGPVITGEQHHVSWLVTGTAGSVEEAPAI